MYRLRSLFLSKLFFIAGTFLLVFIVYQLGRISIVRYDMNRDIRELKNETESLAQNQKRLIQLQEFLSTDFFAEREARLKLGMQKKGEQVAVVQTPKITSLESQAIKTNSVLRENSQDDIGQEEHKKKNPELWWDYFFENQ